MRPLSTCATMTAMVHTSTYTTLPGSGAELLSRLVVSRHAEAELVERDSRCVVEEAGVPGAPTNQRQLTWATDRGSIMTGHSIEKLWEIPRCEVIIDGVAPKSPGSTTAAAAAVIDSRISQLEEQAAATGLGRIKIVVWDDARVQTSPRGLTIIYTFGAVAL